MSLRSVSVVFAFPLLALASTAHAACPVSGSPLDRLLCTTTLANDNEAELLLQGADVAANADAIAANADAIAANADAIALSTSALAANTDAITLNADAIATNAAETGAALELICDLAEGLKAYLPADNPLVAVCDLSFTVFVTSTTQAGDLGGIQGADAVCQGLADAAGLEGTYEAWLSDGSTSPRGRFAGNIPYRLVDGTQIASDTEDLFDSSLGDEIDLDEGGVQVPLPDVLSNVWTGTNADGTARNKNCLGWTSAAPAEEGHAGRTNRRNDDWISTSNESCSDLYHLYCFEQ